MYLKDVSTVRKLLVGERFSINSKQCMPDAHSVPFTKCNLGRITFTFQETSL